MGIFVNTNVSSLMAQRSLSNATSSLNKSIERLSTGYRINRAADDAAGLSISQGLESQARGSQQALSNAQTGINLLQTAEGDLSIIQDNLQRIRDLAVQAANGTNGTAERTAIKEEVDQRAKEITRLSSSSTFNAIKILNGSSTTLMLQIGANYDPTAVSLNALTIGSPLGRADATALGINDTSNLLTNSFTSSTAAASYINLVDSAITSISKRRSTIGSLQNRLDSTVQSLTIKIENMTASKSRIRDTDVAQESANLTKSQILQQASASLLAQANQTPSIALSLLG